MNKLVHRKYNFFISLEENWVNELVIEEPSIFAAFVKEFVAQTEGEEGDFILSDTDRILPIDKNIIFVKDLFSMDTNQRKLLTKLYSQLNEYANDIFAQERTFFYQSYIRYMDYICEKSRLPLAYEVEPETQDIFKMAKIKVDCQAESLLEQVVEYVNASVELLHQNIFVFLNLKLFLTKEELEALYYECFNRKVYLILIETIFQEKLPKEKVCIIDKDQCIIYL